MAAGPAGIRTLTGVSSSPSRVELRPPGGSARRNALAAAIVAVAVAVVIVLAVIGANADREDPAGTPITAWRPPGAAPLSDRQAAARVRPAAAVRPGNSRPNGYRPSAAELEGFRRGQVGSDGQTAVGYNPLAARVTGAYSGTTDEILQWVAHKWGIPEDVVRAVATTESSWRMSQQGDRAWAADPARYPSFSRIPGTSDVAQSLGIMQVKWTPEGLHRGTEPLRWKSTAFNADYWGAVVRYYYDGRCGWCGPGYGRGQPWASVGAWFNPSPWGTSSDYVATVRRHVKAKPWRQPGF